MSVKFSNNAVTALTDAPLLGALSFNVADASAFPTIGDGAGDWTYVTLASEVVKVTAIVDTTFTCDATLNAHAVGESVELRMTSELLTDFAEDTDTLLLANADFSNVSAANFPADVITALKSTVAGPGATFAVVGGVLNITTTA